MKCSDCGRELEVGDHYISDTPSGFIKTEDEHSELFNEVAVSLFGGTDGKLIYCEDCTEPGGDYYFETVYGDEE